MKTTQQGENSMSHREQFFKLKYFPWAGTSDKANEISKLFSVGHRLKNQYFHNNQTNIFKLMHINVAFMSNLKGKKFGIFLHFA